MLEPERSHIIADGAQTIRVHIQYPQDARGPDFANKRRMTLMAEAVPLAIGAPEGRTATRATSETIEHMVSTIHRPDDGNACHLRHRRARDRRFQFGARLKERKRSSRIAFLGIARDATYRSSFH
jgi:hypothetical protein